MENSNDTAARAAIWIGIGCLVAVICLVVGAISGIGGLFWLSEPPDDIDVAVSAPAQVEIGQEVRIEIIVQNNSSQPSELASIDIGQQYLDGIVIFSSVPGFESTNEYESLGVGYRTYYFDQTISAGGSLTVVFTREA